MLPRLLITLVLLALIAASQTSAQTPQGTAFTYQGVLKQNGNAVNGNVDMVFDLFDAAVGGNQVGASLQFTSGNGNPVNVVNGVYDVTLDFGPTAFMTPVSDQRFLRVTVNGTALAPRTQIQSEPYALQAQTAELAYSVSNASIGTAQILPTQVQRRVSGTCASNSAVSAVNQDGSVSCQATGQGTITGVTAGNGLSGGGTSGSVGLGIADPLTLQGGDATSVLTVFNTGAGGGASIAAQSATGQGVSANGGTIGVNAQGKTYGLYASTGQATGIGVYASNAASTGTPVALLAESIYGTGGIAVSAQANGANSIAVQGANNLGLGVSGTGKTGVSGSSTDLAGYGVFGTNANSYGVYGTGSTGVRGETSLAAGYGVAGVNNSTGTGVFGAGQWGVFGSGGAYGVKGTAMTSGGTGVYGSATGGSSNGVYGTADIGVYGAGGTYGVYGTGTSYGVYGNGSSYGLYGSGPTAIYANVPAATTNGFGVYAYSHATTGPGNGVYGQSDSSGGVGVSGYSSSGIGVAGSTSTGLAGKFIGNVTVTGTLSKGAGSFKIDHPLAPESKYLYHSFVESPDMKNIYDGVATLDQSGAAWVTLPEWFEALNRDFRYQLTALGRPGPSLHIADEIAGNRFRIAGGVAGQRVSWQVTGTRHDAFANAHRIPVEVDKSAAERGKYLHPDAFGKSASLAVEPVLAATPEARSPAGAVQEQP